MRFALILAVLSCFGCGPGPKSAKAAPPSKETIVQALEKYNELGIERHKTTDNKLESLAETVGNNTSELEASKEESRALRAVVEKQGADITKILGLLTLESELPKAVEQANYSAIPKGSGITFNGKPIDVQAWLKRPLREQDVVDVEVNRRPAGFATVDAHLRDHGLDGDFSGLTRAERIRLHSVAHLEGVPLKSAAPRKVVMNAAVVLPRATYSGCLNGQCANPTTYYYRRRGK